jgi:transposase
VVVLSAAEDRVLAARVTCGRTEYRDRLRAQIVVQAAHGASNATIAESLSVCVDTVRTWRRRFATATGDRLMALRDRTRSGRPRVHGPAVRAEVVAMACALPAEQDVPLSRWSCPEIARELVARCQVAVSASSVRRACQMVCVGGGSQMLA